MGMFDTIVIEGLKLPSPGKEISKYLADHNLELPNDYQTKDLENSLSTYFIDKSGQLWQNVAKPTGKKIKRDPFPDFRDNRSFLEKLYFKIKHRKFASKTTLWPEYKTVKTKTRLNCDISFYDYVELQGRYVDVEYSASVINGKVKAVRLVKSNLEPEAVARKRKANDVAFFNKLQEDSAKRAIFTSKWYYPILRETYNPVVFFAKLFVQWACNKIVLWSYKWHGV